MRIEFLFGFLGSGKTTLASRILKEWGAQSKLALIVNEFGDVSVDGEILRGNAIDMVELNSGCLCCTLRGSLLNAIEELAGKGAEHLVIEATGVASPEEMLESIGGGQLKIAADIGPITTTVDASKFLKVRGFLGEFYESQLSYCDLVILNKIDLASTDTLEQVRAEVSALNPAAAIRFAERCDIDLTEIMEGPPSRTAAEFIGTVPPANDSHDHEHDHVHAPAESIVIDVMSDMGESEFRAFMAGLPEGIWRAKGFVRLGSIDYLVQYAMGQLEITPVEPKNRHYLVFIGKEAGLAEVKADLARRAERTEAVQ